MPESYEKLTARVKELESSVRAVLAGARPSEGLADTVRPEPAAWTRGHVDLDGRHYLARLRWGNDLQTGAMSLLFEAADGSRVWVDRGGNVNEA